MRPSLGSPTSHHTGHPPVQKLTHLHMTELGFEESLPGEIERHNGASLQVLSGAPLLQPSFSPTVC